MNSPPANPRLLSTSPQLLICLALTCLLFLSGCAQKPWGDPLGEQEEKVYKQLFDKIRSREAECVVCMEVDIRLFITSHVGSRAAAGYLKLMQPSHVRFVSSNPFGQPLVLFISNGQDFQYINTTERLSLSGDAAAFLQTLEAPSVLVSQSWGKWFSGQLPDSGTVEATRKDGANRGVWVTVSSPDSPERKEHLLIDMEKERLLSRILSTNDKILLQIDYHRNSQTESVSSCTQPDMIHVTGLDYGTELSLRISNQEEYPDCRPADFVLPVPPGYLHREIRKEGY